MRSRLTITASAILAVLLACSCTVKEDRTGCPSWVTVNLDGFVALGETEATLSFASPEGPVARNTVDILPYYGGGYVQAVPRTKIRVSVVAGTDNSIIQGDTVRVKRGRTADPLLMSSLTCHPMVDEYPVEAVPHKQYCRIDFVFPHLPSGLDYPFRFRIRTLWDGIGIYSLEPTGGEYEAVVGPNHLGEFFTFLTRQGDGPMLLDIFEPDAGSDVTGELQKTVDLGALFEAAGYDWHKEDLDDVALTVDFSRADVGIRVIEWERDDSYSEVEI